MYQLKNIDYKNVSFTRSDGINVNLIVSLLNPADLNEDFLVLKTEGVDSAKEIDLFYWVNNKRWTLNEFIFFALNNNLCMKIASKDMVELASYGTCSTINRVFGHAFGKIFN